MTMDRISRLTLTSIALVGLTVATASTFSFGQQRTTNLEIDLPEVVAEVKVAYDRHNEAINSGNIAVLNGTFRNDPRTIRYGQAENLYGYKEIERFRAAARPLEPPRTLSKTVITTLWPRLRGGLNADPPREPAWQGWSSDADLGEIPPTAGTSSRHR
jgi:hypothetical protein